MGSCAELSQDLEDLAMLGMVEHSQYFEMLTRKVSILGGSSPQERGERCNGFMIGTVGIIGLLNMCDGREGNCFRFQFAAVGIYLF
jgi:hypothetical protein